MHALSIFIEHSPFNNLVQACNDHTMDIIAYGTNNVHGHTFVLYNENTFQNSVTICNTQQYHYSGTSQ